MIPTALPSSTHTGSSGGALDGLFLEFERYRLSVRSVAPDTVAEELLYLRRFFAYLGWPESCALLFARLSPARLNAFLNEYAQAHGPGSRRWMQHSLRAFLHFAYECSHMDRDLSALVPSVRKYTMGHVPRSLPDECIAALRNGIDRTTASGLRDRAIVALLSTYGVRGVQIRRLCLDHLHWRENRIDFPAAKGGRVVEQHLTAEVGNCLLDYIMQARPQSSHREVFLTLSEPLRPLPCASYLSSILRRRMRELKLTLPDGVSHGTHGFRHAFASRMTGKLPFKEVVDLLGHRDPSTTLIYGKVQLDDLAQAALSWPGEQE